MPRMTGDQIAQHVKRAAFLKSERATFESHCQEIAELIYPEAAVFTGPAVEGQKMMRKIYDSTGIHANHLLASGLFSLLTSSANPWFLLMPANGMEREVAEIMNVLYARSEIMYHEINKSSAGFSTAMHENYLSYGAFGNFVLFIDEVLKKDSLRFQALPIQECYFVQNSEDKVDGLYRKYNRTVHQLVEKFGVDAQSTSVKQMYIDQKWDQVVECMHIIVPRENGDRNSFASTDLPFMSAYIDLKEQHLIFESGYHEQPFMAPRFFKSAHEKYGRGPGHITLPDLKMLMRVQQVVIRAAQKATDPALLLPHEGFLKPLRTTPGGLNYYNKSRVNLKNDIDVLPSGNPELGDQFADSLRNRIREAFYVDQLQLNQGPQMTATEVIQRTEEKLRLMGPFLGRAQMEFLGPAVVRVHGLLERAGRFEGLEMPEGVGPIQIVYISPIAKAQEQVQANGLMRAISILETVYKYNPESMDILDTDDIARKVFTWFNAPPSFLKDKKAIQKVRKDRADAQAKKEQAENLAKTGQGLAGLGQAADSEGLQKMVQSSAGGGEFGQFMQ